MGLHEMIIFPFQLKMKNSKIAFVILFSYDSSSRGKLIVEDEVRKPGTRKKARKGERERGR